MSALRPTKIASQPDTPTRPYPAWPSVADRRGWQGLSDAGDRQAMKEAKLWRDLADEPRPGQSDGGTAERISDADPQR